MLTEFDNAGDINRDLVREVERKVLSTRHDWAALDKLINEAWKNDPCRLKVALMFLNNQLQPHDRTMVTQILSGKTHEALENEKLDRELLADHPQDAEPPTCGDCRHSKPYGICLLQCERKEGNESGRGESNVMSDDDACKDFDAKDRFAPAYPPRKCYKCGAVLCWDEVLNLPLDARAMCGCCKDFTTGLKQDAQNAKGERDNGL